MDHDRGERAWSRTAPPGPWDAIVVGSGMGGMTAAALLSALGRRTLVLEQHYVPGGFTHAFKRKGWTWDVGVHAVGEVTEHSLTGRLLQRLTEGRLRWASLGPVYDAFEFPGGFAIDFPDTPGQFRENLAAAFPREGAAIDAYLARVKEVSGAMRGYYLARTAPRGLRRLSDLLLARRAAAAFERPAGEEIAALTADERLRAVLCAQWGYYGVPPARASFAIQALVARHFLHGGYYPVGGSQVIARELLAAVARQGGWTRVVADVATLVLERGRAVGVRLRSGEEVRAPIVVSAVGALATVQRLLPPEVRAAAWCHDVARLRPAAAHVCLYVGLEGDVRAAGAGAANRWFYETWRSDDEAWQVTTDGAPPRAPVLYVSFPSLKDPAHDAGPSQRHTAEVVTFVPWSAFERWRDTRWRRRGEDYDAFKARLQEALLEQVLERLPGLRPLVRHVELSTPLSTDHFCRPSEGSIYGLAPTPERFRCPWLRPRTPIPGLFFAGSDVATCGVIGAMMGGVLAAVAASPVRALRLLAST